MTSPRRFRLGALVLVLAVGVGGTAFAATGGHKAGPQESLAFANVLEDGTLNMAASSDNISESSISHTNPGVYCFTNLAFLPSSAVVSGDNSFGNNDTLASVAIDNTTPQAGLAGCPDGATLRVRTLDENGVAGTTGGSYDPQLLDHRFVIWIRGDRP